MGVAGGLRQATPAQLLSYATACRAAASKCRTLVVRIQRAIKIGKLAILLCMDQFLINLRTGLATRSLSIRLPRGGALLGNVR
jgi:hypothetical protein